MALDEAPPFWWRRHAWQAWAMSPLAWFYGRVSGRRMAAEPAASVAVPVICVGNFIAGGAGKTPVVQALAGHAAHAGFTPGILTRGYGGGIVAPTIVDPKRHDSRDVGDEPIAHAATATTVVSANRAAGARLLLDAGCDLIIMDDGFQSPNLAKDYSIAVVDAVRGLGNGFAHPAGPLRAPLSVQMARADVTLVMGTGSGADKAIRVCARHGKPVEHARVLIKGRTKLKGMKVLAYAGIGDPDKFFDSLEAAGADVVERRAFGDHHLYVEEEIRELLDAAKHAKVQLVTTTKDAARLAGLGKWHDRLFKASRVIEIELAFEDPAFPDRALRTAAKRAERRLAAEHLAEVAS